MNEFKNNQIDPIKENREKERNGTDPNAIDKFDEMMAEIYAEEDYVQPEPDEKDLYKFRNSTLCLEFMDLYKKAWRDHCGYPYETFVHLLTVAKWHKDTYFPPKMKLQDVMKRDGHLWGVK